MISSVSSNFQTAIADVDRKTNAIVSFTYGGVTTEYYSDSIIEIDYNHGVVGDYFELGKAPSAYVKLKMRGIPTSQVLYGSEVIVYLGVEVSTDTYEYVKMGTFNVDEYHIVQDITTLHLFDNMVFMNVSYTQVATTFQGIVNEILVGFTHTITIPSYLNAITPNIAVGRTRRQVLSDIATLLGCYCYCDRDGNFALKSYEKTRLTTSGSGTGTTVTLNFREENVAPYAVGSTIIVNGVTPTAYNGTYTVTACTTKSVTFAGSATGTITTQGNINSSSMSEVFPIQYKRFTRDKTFTIKSLLLENDTYGYGNLIDDFLSTTSAVANGTTLTVTFANQTQILYPVGTQIVLVDLVPSSLNGTYTVQTSTTSSVVVASSITATATTQGSIYPYENAETDIQLYAYSSYATSTITDLLMKTARNLTMTTFNLNWIGNPAMEIGDRVLIHELLSDSTVNDFYLNVGKIRIIYNGNIYSELSNIGTVAMGTSGISYEYALKNNIDTGIVKSNFAYTRNLLVENTSSGLLGSFRQTGTSVFDVYTDKVISNVNFGVGTTAPAFAVGTGLEIQQAGTATLRLERTSATASAFEIRAASGVAEIDARGATPITLITNSAERMRILANGNVGIGTTSPANKLDVNGTTSATAFDMNTGAASYGLSIRASSQSSTYYQIGMDTGSNFSIVTNIAGVQAGRFLIDTSGNVRIPSLSGTGTRAVYSTSVGVLTNTSSDKRLKENITDLKYGLDAINKLRAVKFKWIDKEKYGDQDEIGFIAQEVREVVYEVVGENTDGMLSLDYAKIVPVIVNAIQELTERVNMLESK